MKKNLTGIFLAALAILISFQAAAGAQKKGVKMKTLVIYYSLTGNTEIAAKKIAEELKADLRKVEDLKPYGKVSVYFTGGFSALFEKNGKIKPVDFNLKEYGRIFIGSPVWGGRPVPAINTFISNADFSDKEVVTFVTMGGKNPGKSIGKMGSKITSRGGKIIGSFAIQSGGKKPDEISRKAKEEARRFVR